MKPRTRKRPPKLCRLFVVILGGVPTIFAIDSAGRVWRTATWKEAEPVWTRVKGAPALEDPDLSQGPSALIER